MYEYSHISYYLKGSKFIDSVGQKLHMYQFKLNTRTKIYNHLKDDAD
jgi:hypothetical protein